MLVAALPPQDNLKYCELRVAPAHHADLPLSDGIATLSLTSADETNKLGIHAIQELLGV